MSNSVTYGRMPTAGAGMTNAHWLKLAARLEGVNNLMHDFTAILVIFQQGHHVIEVNTGLEGEWCSLVPVGFRCKVVTTSGLKWNLGECKYLQNRSTKSCSFVSKALWYRTLKKNSRGSWEVIVLWWCTLLCAVIGNNLLGLGCAISQVIDHHYIKSIEM